MPRAPSLMPLLVAAFLAGALSGCDAERYIIKDELGEAVESGESVREMRGRVTFAALERAPDGSGRLEFLFVYLLGIVDPEGVDAITWRYALFHPDRTELAAEQDVMREAEGLTEDGAPITQVLVHSELPGRRRTLDVPPGRLVDGQTYVLRLTLWYRSEILFEVLVPVVPGAPLVDPVDPAELPELLNGF